MVSPPFCPQVLTPAGKADGSIPIPEVLFRVIIEWLKEQPVI
jgi:hypothetical protein